MKRCAWVNLNNNKYIQYHDNEWGKEVHNDEKLYELLILEIFQAGLSWETVLNKRDYIKLAFDNYDKNQIMNYNENKIKELMNNKNIIRNKLKILSIINNTKVFINIQKEFKSFNNYIWKFTNNKIIYEVNKTQSILSDTISKDLKKRGMKFIGTTIIYAYLQAIGIIYSHDKDCFLYKIK